MLGANKTPPSVVAALVLVSAAVLARPGLGQERAEPIYDDLMALVTHDAFTVGTLFQAVVDPSIDSDDPQPANVSVAAARLLLSGALDNGFRYFLQTNFAASPTVLDARVGWVYDDRFGVWAGRFKTPFNQELIDYAGSIDFVNRARVVSQLGTDRQHGVLVAGQMGVTAVAVGGFTGPNASQAGDDLAGVARVAVTPDLGAGQSLRAGVSGAIGRDGAVGGRSLGAGYDGSASLLELDARYERGRLLVAFEGVLGSYRPDVGDDADGSGFYLTGGWRPTERTQLLARWDRFTDVAADESVDNFILGFNVWPTSASEIQVNWVAPVAGSASPHKLLVNFQVGFGGPQTLF
jgi:hypothetical protein